MLISMKKYQEIQHFSGSYKHRLLFVLLINVKMTRIVGILKLMTRKNVHAQLS